MVEHRYYQSFSYNEFSMLEQTLRRVTTLVLCWELFLPRQFDDKKFGVRCLALILLDTKRLMPDWWNSTRNHIAILTLTLTCSKPVTRSYPYPHPILALTLPVSSPYPRPSLYPYPHPILALTLTCKPRHSLINGITGCLG